MPLLVRAVVVWAFLRGFLGAEAVTSGASVSDAVLRSFEVAPWLVGVVVLVTWVEWNRRGVGLFLRNLGISFGQAAALVASMVVALETILFVVFVAGA